MESHSSATTPDYGRRLLPSLIDHIAQTAPNTVWASIPKDADDLSQGWKNVTYATFANAVNRVAHRFISNTGPGTDYPTVAYIGPNDPRYLIFVLAALKAGYKALLISPRNSLEGQLNLFEQTDCNVICYTDNLHSTVNPLLSERDMKAIVVSSLDAWLDDTKVPHFPYVKTFDQVEYDPFVVLHTSGSTGLPKPIVVRQGMITTSDKAHLLDKFHGHEYWVHAFAKAERFFLPMPLFHAAGLYMSFMAGVYFQTPIVLAPASKPLSVDLIQACIKYGEADGVLLAPSLIEEMAYDEQATKLLSTLKYAAFAGGAVARDAGDKLVAQGVNLISAIASTECAPMSLYVPDSKHWYQYIFDDAGSNFKWKAVEGQEGVYEQIFVKKDPRSGLQGCFYTFPDLDEWSTKDLFKKVPDQPGAWTYYGRADNIIVFSNGEKLNPVTIEDTITGNPKVSGAVVVGTGKFQPSLLIEPMHYPDDDTQAKALIEEIWPIVVRANKETVAHGQIGKQYIALTKPEKPFPRAGKGSIQRALALQLYQAEIEQLYKDAGESQSTDAIQLDTSSEDSLAKSIQGAFSSTLHIPDIDPDTDFFAAGIDSMQVLTMSRALQRGLRAAGISTDASTIASRVIYTNPTPRRLASSLFRQITSSESSANANWSIHDMEAMIQKYSNDLPSLAPLASAPATKDLTVILTGSTGAIGSYLLDFLSSLPSVDRIIALNRATDGHARQTQASASRGLSTTFAKVTFYHADLSRHDLGLSVAEYADLKSHAHVIIHNQWQVDFNLSLASFEPHVRGVRHLIDLSIASPLRPRITFISSIAVVAAYTDKATIPEAPLHDLNFANGGYGQSKLVGSLILEAAEAKSGVSSAIIRVGQVAGPLSSKGAWNRQEWLPSIVASSGYLGALPATLGPMDTLYWVPIETEACLIRDVALSGAQGYFAGVNPHAARWADIKGAVRQYYGERVTEELGWAEWVARLKQSQAGISDKDVARNPGVKLLDFYEGMVQAMEAGHGAEAVPMATQKTQEVSAALRALEAVKSEWMELWCRQWAF